MSATPVLAGTVPVAPLNGKAGVDSLKEPVYFSENSIRRDPSTESERASMLRLTINDQPTCSAFLIANTQGRHLVATARHCLDWKMSEGCAKNFFRLVDEPTKTKNSCIRVVAGSSKDDMIILETHLNTETVRKMKPLKLAGYCPFSGDHLKQLGYPADKYRKSKLTVTEHCIDNSGMGKNPVDEKLNIESTPSLAPTGNKEFDTLANKLKFEPSWSNCTDFGGNSGGPVLLAGTDHVMGMATRYLGGYEVLDKQSSNPYEATCGFVRHNRRALDEAGVVIVDTHPDDEQIPAQQPFKAPKPEHKQRPKKLVQ